MSCKFVLALALVAVCCYARQSSAVEMIEMTDANKAILLINLAKTLEGVQNAYKNNFAFETVKDAKKFLDNCAFVAAKMDESSDDDFEGMAKTIKALLEEPSIKAACSVSSKQIKEAGLDDLETDYKVEEHDYLSRKKTAGLVEIKKKVEESPELSQLFGKLVAKRINNLAEAALKEAPMNVEIFFDAKNEPKGFFDFNQMNYKHTCQIPAIKPICKLVRRSADENISAIDADLSDFIKMVESNDEAKLSSHEQASGYSVSDVARTCAGMSDGVGRFLRPIDMIELWVAEGLMTSEQFEAAQKANSNLAFYNELNKLCKVVEKVQ